MSDKKVERAVQDALMKHIEAIERQIKLQYVIFQQMQAPLTTDHSFWSLTSRYKECDRLIGEHRTSMRNLKAQM